MPAEDTLPTGHRGDYFEGRLERGVAQPGSAPASGAGGRRFKSGRPDYDVRQ